MGGLVSGELDGCQLGCPLCVCGTGKVFLCVVFFFFLKQRFRMLSSMMSM